MLGIATCHYMTTLCDKKKGSMTNRNQCAVEHFKNDLKYGYFVTAPLALGIAAIKYKKISSPILKSVGNFISNFLGQAGKLIKSQTLKNNIATICKHPKALGAGTLAAIGITTAVTALSKFMNKKGRINQKYEDAAKIESQTKNVVLDLNDKNNYAEMAV